MSQDLKAFYPDEEIRAALVALMAGGVDIDAIPDSCSVEDVVRMSNELARPV